MTVNRRILSCLTIALVVVNILGVFSVKATHLNPGVSEDLGVNGSFAANAQIAGILSGGSFTISIDVSGFTADNDRVNSYDIRIGFDSTVLDATAVDFTGCLFATSGLTAFTLFPAPGTVEEVPAVVRIAQAVFAGDVLGPGTSGTGCWAKITFSALATPSNSLIDVGLNDNADPVDDQDAIVSAVVLAAIPHDTFDAIVNPVVVNQPPVLAAIGNREVNEQSLLTFTATATDPDTGQTLSFSLGPGAPSGASITTAGVFTWTPTEAQGVNTYMVTVIVTDNGTPPASDQETIEVRVNEVNQVPVLSVPGSQTGQVGVPLTFTVSATDSDLDATGAALSTITLTCNNCAIIGATFTSTPAKGTVTGGFSWTPAAEGPVSVSFTADDGAGGTDTDAVMINIGPVANQPPVLSSIGPKAVGEEAVLTFTATASDPDGDPLTFSIGPATSGGFPTGATIIPTSGAFTWTPMEAQGPNMYVVRVTVSDASLTDFEDVTITVSEVNVAPVLTPTGAKTVNEEATLAFDATATDADIPAQTLSFSLGPGAPAGASITSQGVFSWTPSEAQGPNSLQVTIVVTDSLGSSDSELITITVSEVNKPPALTVPGAQTVKEGDQLAFTIAATDPDAPANTVTVSVSGLPQGATFDSATGSISFTPAAAQVGQKFTLTFTATDNGEPLLSDTETVEISVLAAREPPVAAFTPSKIEVDVGEEVTFDARQSSDPDGGSLSFFWDFGDGRTLNATSAVASHSYGTAGTFTVTLQVTDDEGSKDIQRTDVTVRGAPPQAAPLVPPVYIWILVPVGAGVVLVAYAVLRRGRREETA